MAEFIPAILFVLSSGLLFQKQFRENASLVVLAGLIGLVSSYFLFDQVATIWNRLHAPGYFLGQPVASPAPAPTALPAAPTADASKLNDRVADAVSKAQQYAVEAHEQAANAVIVVDQAEDAAEQARDAAEKAKTSAEGFVLNQSTSDGVTYSGEVDDQKLKNGHGVVTWGNGDRYEGEWLHGNRTGYGVYHYADANKYGDEVEYLHYENAIEGGPGKEIWKSKDHYEGQYLKGAISGLGVYTSADGAVLAGQFVTSKLNGFGVDVLTDKSRSVGQFHKNDLNGYGAKFDANGNLIEQGIYEDGKLEQALTP